MMEYEWERRQLRRHFKKIFSDSSYFWLHWVFFAAQAFLWLWWTGATLHAMHDLLIVVASLGAEHGLSGICASELWHLGSVAAAPRFHGCGIWVELLHGMWDLPRPWIKLLSSALAIRFFTTEPPGKPKKTFVTLDISAVFELLKWEIIIF